MKINLILQKSLQLVDLLGFTIPKGSNTKTIAHILKEKKIFFYPNLFILTARIFNKSKRIHSGDYELNNKISTWQLLRKRKEKEKF